jgi:hypothetical protein
MTYLHPSASDGESGFSGGSGGFLLPSKFVITLPEVRDILLTVDAEALLERMRVEARDDGRKRTAWDMKLSLS